MSDKSALRYVSFAVAGMCVLFAGAAPASAGAISWTTWTSNSAGSIAPLGLTVSYSGEMNGLSASGYPSWNPASTFSGGTVGNAPPSTGRMVTLTGGSATTVDTITFSSPVVNPVLAIWSLGAPGNLASFNFTASEPFAIQSGGPSAEYGGSSITVCAGNSQAVCGAEGNGTVQFTGTYNQISWTNPVYENYFGFTVGVAGVATPQVPEPASMLLVVSGLVGAALLRRRKA